MYPPTDLGLPEDFSLTIPAHENAPDLGIATARLTKLLAEIYSLSFQQIEPILTTADTVMSLSIQDEETTTGSISFKRFEGLMEKLKGILLHSAAFAVYEDPIIEKIPPEADLFLSNCKFLQTSHGSFVANVQLPTNTELRDRLLFEEEAPKGTSVKEKVTDILSFALGPALSGNSEIFSDQFVTNNLDILNVNVLEDVRDLTQKVPNAQLVFSFLDIESTQTINSDTLTADRRHALTEYVKFVRSIISENLTVNVIGPIVELRSRNPQSNRNYVLVQGEIEGQRAFLAVTLRNDLYAEAIQAHRHGRPVRVRGLARRMKTQFKIVELDLFHSV